MKLKLVIVSKIDYYYTNILTAYTNTVDFQSNIIFFTHKKDPLTTKKIIMKGKYVKNNLNL